MAKHVNANSEQFLSISMSPGHEKVLPMGGSPSFLGPSHPRPLAPHSSIPTWLYYLSHSALFAPLRWPLWRRELCDSALRCNPCTQNRPFADRLLNKQTSLCSVASAVRTLCDPTVCDLPGSSVRGTLQAGILEGVTVTSSRGSSWPRNWPCRWVADSFSLFAGGLFTC